MSLPEADGRTTAPVISALTGVDGREAPATEDIAETEPEEAIKKTKRRRRRKKKPAAEAQLDDRVESENEQINDSDFVPEATDEPITEAKKTKRRRRKKKKPNSESEQAVGEDSEAEIRQDAGPMINKPENLAPAEGEEIPAKKSKRRRRKKKSNEENPEDSVELPLAAGFVPAKAMEELLTETEDSPDAVAVKKKRRRRRSSTKKKLTEAEASSTEEPERPD